MIVQIYEIQTPQEAERCIEVGVDHLGSVLLSQDQWRQPSVKAVMELSRGTPVRNSLIPLFKDPDTLFRVLDYYRPHFVHFCESLTDPEGRNKDLEPLIVYQATVKERFPELGIMRSIPIPGKGLASPLPTLELARSLEPVSHMFLTDTWLGREPVEGYIGITGKTGDWEVARELVLQSKIPVILAGGLSPENAYGAITEVKPAGADSCTQTNRLDGDGRPLRFRKDFVKVAAFVAEVRRAARAIEGLSRIPVAADVR